jgi:hypothetical protein
MERDFDIHKWQAKYLKENMVDDQDKIIAMLTDDGTVNTVGGILNNAMFLTRNNSYDVDTVLEVVANLCNINLNDTI